MRRRASSKSSLFLLEMMISVLFFAIAAAVCIQVFVKAHQLSRKAEELNMAAGAAASAAELLASEAGEEELTLYYDENWMPCAQGGAQFFLEVSAARENGLKSGKICVTDKAGECIYELETGHYFPWKLEREVNGSE